jgi:hypothetical protein
MNPAAHPAPPGRSSKPEAMMRITPKTRINDLIDAYPFLLEFLPAFNAKYELLKNKTVRATVGRMANLRKVAAIGGVPVNDLLRALQAEIGRRTGTPVDADFAAAEDGAARLATLKAVVRDFHSGHDLAAAKRRFAELIQEVDPSEIAAMEELLIQEGMPVGEITHLCDAHMEIMKEGLDEAELPEVPPGHPVHTFQAENTWLIEAAGRLDAAAKKLDGGDPAWDALGTALDGIARAHVHYLRKEHQLFPFLERHNITGPTQVMWAVHDDIRTQVKALREAASRRDAAAVRAAVPRLARAVVEMTVKEEKILLPMAMTFLSDPEWAEIRRGEGEIGYVLDEPPAPWPVGAPVGAPAAGPAAGTISLNTGALTLAQLDAMLTVLPIDVSFVDANDEVRYYSGGPHRIFPRSPGVIGRKVQNCHPPKSIDTVNHILDAFKAGTRSTAEFWITMQGRFLHIRYYAVRDAHGQYIGTVEFMQDVTDIRALQGERRLLEWDKA